MESDRDEWHDFNEHVWHLLDIVRRNRHQARISDVEAADREGFAFCAERLDMFLWKIGLHLTRQVDLAATVVTETRAALLARLNRCACDSVPKRFFARWTIARHKPNLWLFLRARECFRLLKQRLGVVMTSRPKVRLQVSADFDFDYRPDPAQKQWATEHCPMRECKPRNRPDAKGTILDAPTLRATDHCLQACDLLLLYEFAFTLRQIAFAFGIKRKTVWALAEQCRKQISPPQERQNNPSSPSSAGRHNSR